MTPQEEQEVSRTVEQLVGTPGKDYALGGAYEGAAQFDKQIAGWAPALMSADADMLPDKPLLDARSRDMGRNDAYIQWGGNQHKDSIVGSFYMLNAKPNGGVLGMPDGWSDEFQEEVEPLFSLWAESPMNWVDMTRVNSLTEMIRLAVGVFVFSGEALATAEWAPSRGRDFHTAIQMVDTDRLKTPPEHVGNPRWRAGIRHDRYGAPLSAAIQVTHPHEYGMFLNPNGEWFKEVPFRKPWGRQMVMHLKEQQRVDQTRAVSDLTAGLREIAIARKFRDVTLQNAVLNASYAATVESELPAEAVFMQLGQGKDMTTAIHQYAGTYMSQVAAWAKASKGLIMDGLKIPHLYPGTRFKMQPAGTPGGVGQQFEVSLLRYLAATLGITYEEMSRDYSKTNYSSMKAAMLSTWRFMQARKRIVADKMANFVYRLWLEEAVHANKLTTFPARMARKLYTDGRLNVMFDALSSAEWIGAARGQIDELKETQAAVLRLKYGLSTREYELGRLGKDWRVVFRQQERENTEAEKRGLVFTDDPNMMNAASGDPREDRQDGEAGDADRDEE